MCSNIPLHQWGLQINNKNNLTISEVDTIELAKIYGTPLHVINEPRLIETAHTFLTVFKNNYPGNIEVYFALKSNPVGAVLKTLHALGFGSEIISPYELYL